MEDNLHEWLTIDAFCQATGKGRRTIERLLAQQHLHTAFDKRQEGRKPVIVIDPAEVPKLQAETLRPVVQSPKPAMPAPAADSMAVFLKALERLLAPSSGVIFPPTQKTYLTEREAAAVLGFPVAEVKRLVQSGAIPSIRLINHARRIARRDLETYTHAPEEGARDDRLQMAGPQGGDVNGAHITKN